MSKKLVKQHIAALTMFFVSRLQLCWPMPVLNAGVVTKSANFLSAVSDLKGYGFVSKDNKM